MTEQNQLISKEQRVLTIMAIIKIHERILELRSHDDMPDYDKYKTGLEQAQIELAQLLENKEM